MNRRTAAVVLASLLAACTSGPAPTPSPSPSVSPASPRPSADPSAAAAALRRQMDEVSAQVPPIRLLDPLEDVPDRIIDEAQLRNELRDRAAVDQPEELLRRSTDLLVRLGLAKPGVDLAKLVEEASVGQILGFYDTDTEQMTLVQRGAGFGAVERMTLAHEFTHALQDQHFDLDSLGVDDLTNSDRAIARRTLVEGDATLLMVMWAGQHLNPVDLLGLFAQSLTPQASAGLDELPPLIRQQFLFPYEQGLEFVQDAYEDGGWEVVDDMYDDPPDSTEQVIHPEKYLDGEEPTQVLLPRVAAALGVGWSEALTDTMGELGTRVWLQQGSQERAATMAAAGWGGDRVGSYDGPGGAWAVIWRTRWDSAVDATEFERAARESAGELGAARVQPSVTGAGADVWVLVASDAKALETAERAVAARGD
jgi:hypothetical protein